ncbi:MAG: WG repeat-containing protein [Alistipes sp.]|nr:WG repeat-containing protein [Alistipes sp.]
MIFSVANYILAVKHLDRMARTLGAKRIYALSEERDREVLKCSVGNSVLVVQVMCEGVHKAMRIYMRPNANLRAIYGDNYYPKELLVSSSSEVFGLADVVLCDWKEGVSLQSKIEELAHRPDKMAALSQMFEEFALWLLGERWAHGDLKPENIILSKDGLSLIDLDAMYCEGLRSENCVEIGTREFQHPLRTMGYFNKSIDDYPIALISTAIAALSLDSSLARKVVESDYLLIRPDLAVAGKDEILERIERLFAERGDARHYRIARLLRSSHPSLPRLKEFIEAKPKSIEQTEPLLLEYYNGYWGFSHRGEFVIPPIYDLAFEFSEGLALVRIGDVWHFIDTQGRVVITCGRGSGIKPFNNGTTRIIRDDGEFVIYKDGKIERL